MPKANTATATVSHFDPLDRRWYLHTTKTKVSVPIGSTLRQMLKNIMRAAGTQERNSRFRVLCAADGIRVFLFSDGVFAEINQLRHAEGTQIPDKLDDDYARPAAMVERAFPPAWRKGWAHKPYKSSSEDKRRYRAMTLGLRAVEDRDFCAALLAAAEQYDKSAGAR
jgi:hypothetical protein